MLFRSGYKIPHASVRSASVMLAWSSGSQGRRRNSYVHPPSVFAGRWPFLRPPGLRSSPTGTFEDIAHRTVTPSKQRDAALLTLASPSTRSCRSGALATPESVLLQPLLGFTPPLRRLASSRRPLPASARTPRPSVPRCHSRDPVPSSWFCTTATVCSVETNAGLLHPASGPGVRRVCPLPWPVRVRRPSETRSRSSRRSTLRRIPLTGSRTASPRPLPPCCFRSSTAHSRRLASSLEGTPGGASIESHLSAAPARPA